MLDVRDSHIHLGFPVVFTNLQCEVPLTHVVIKCTDFKFIASQLVALDAFIFIRMVKSLDSRVALVASKPARAKIPPNPG